jgi:hypothetical protein
LVTTSAGELTLEYRFTPSAEEALIEATQIDTDSDGKITPAEQDAHFAEVARRLGAGLQLRAGTDENLAAQFVRYSLGNSLAQTFRFRIATDSDSILLEDRNFAHKPGQVRILTGQGIQAAEAADADLSHIDRLSIKIQREKAAP